MHDKLLIEKNIIILKCWIFAEYKIRTIINLVNR